MRILSPTENKRFNELIGFVGLSLAILIALSLLSYSPHDVSFNVSAPPLGSGPYRIKDFVAGRSLTLERVKDYWAANLPVQIGLNNLDELRFEFFRDNIVALEAFKADQVDWIAENSAKQWATAYEFPAMAEKRTARPTATIARNRSVR